MLTRSLTNHECAHPLDQAAMHMAGRTKLAIALDVSVAAIGNWKKRGVPYEKCPAIERLTGGKVTRQQLRPDDWAEMWPELASPPASRAQAATETVAGGANA